MEEALHFLLKLEHIHWEVDNYNLVVVGYSCCGVESNCDEAESIVEVANNCGGVESSFEEGSNCGEVANNCGVAVESKPEGEDKLFAVGNHTHNAVQAEENKTSLEGEDMGPKNEALK